MVAAAGAAAGVACARLVFTVPADLYACGNGAAAASDVRSQVFLRHGDRTLSDPGTCWPNDQAVWPCQLTQLQANTELSGEATAAVSRAYRLQYIAGVEDEKGCAGVGQLTERGYDQEVTNGQHLRDAYVTREGLLPEVSAAAPAVRSRRTAARHSHDEA